MNPKISVVVPVHNTEKYLIQCISSIMAQSLQDIEIICVDDGSTDNSRKILLGLAAIDSRITVLCRDVASGSAALPRNEGLEKAQGKYIIFLDSDDYFDVTMFEKMYNYAEMHQADLVMCDNYRVYDETREFRTADTELHKDYLPKQTVFSYKDIPNSIFQISNAAVWHKLILRELVEQNHLKFQLSTPILDDIYFVNTLLVLAKRIAIMEDRLMYYRVLRPEAQTNAIGKHKESIYKAFSALNKKIMELGIYNEVKNSLQRWTLSTMAWWMHSISSYKSYSEIYDLYRNKYMKELRLLDTKFDETDDLKYFYESIMVSKFRPSLKVILESLLKENSNIILYGAGEIGHRMYDAISQYGKHNIVLWCDRNADNMQDERIRKTEEIRNYKPDAILIAIGNEKIVNEVKEYLVMLGIDKNIIMRI